MAAREEDKSMAGLLRRSLAQDAGAGSGSGDCPEPEILAAYFDHALDAEETARYDLHFSRCSHCREQLAAMARAGGVGDADAAGKRTEGAWAWLTGPRWLMPAAAMLVALLAITGIALRMRKPVAPTNYIAMARPDALPQANSAPVTTPAPPTNSEPSPETALSSGAASSAPRARRADAAGAPVAPSESPSSRELGAVLPSRTDSHANTATRGGELSRVGVVGGSGAKSAAAPVMRPIAPKPQSQTSPAMTRGAMQAGNGVSEVSGSGGGVAGGTMNSADQTVTATAAVPPVDVAEPSKILPEKKTEAYSAKSDAAVSVQVEVTPQPNARGAKASASTSGAGKSAAAAPGQSARAMNLAANQPMEAAALAKMQEAQISSNLLNRQIQTPDAKILWMIAGPAAIEKSEDGGASWKTESLDTRAAILAGTAPSVKICWLVGASGAILRTTNGAHWKTIRPPAETDFVRVEATDALTATVTAQDGRRFSTSDGGKSWSGVK